MAVTDPSAIKFSNEQARVSADLMAKAYYRSVDVSTRWVALGANQAALDVMSADIRACADAILTAYLFVYKAEVIWFLGINAAFSSNDTTAVSDNSPGDGRPAATTFKVNAIMSRAIEFQNWLLSATESFTDALRNNRAALNTVAQASNDGPPTLVLADAGNLINRCNELKSNYEATANGNLNNVLAFAVNPNP